MHDQLLNHDVARLHRAELLRASGRRHRYDRQPRARREIGHGLLVQLGSLMHWHRRPKPAMVSR